ncbi:MAG: uracil-DNA glycosylase [Flavobacteriales bacterium]|jgi:uracil-DNA glycosylase
MKNMTHNRINVRDISSVLNAVRACTLCEDLALGPKPILQLNPAAKILIVGQAPGRKTHHKGIPFDDPSGDRLRDWMGVARDTFYNDSAIAILPMAFCYPGAGKSGDLPPPRQCAEQWRIQLLSLWPNVELTLVIGQYALDWHLAKLQARTLTETVGQWQNYWPKLLPMPHPSPRNNRWLKTNPWFSSDVLPKLKLQVESLL